MCGLRQGMEKAYGGGIVGKEDMWDNVVPMKGCKYTMESEANYKEIKYMEGKRQ